MEKRAKVFERVSLLDPALHHLPKSSKLHGKTDNHVLATSTSFQDIKDSYRTFLTMPKTHAGTRDLKQREMSLKSHNAAGLGSAQSHSLVADPVKVDDTVMAYIHKKQHKELERIKERHAVSIVWHKSLVTFSPPNGIQAQFAREHFITLYQKTATGLQIRTYPCHSKILAFCHEEFPELLITTTDEKQMTLTGSFVSLGRFETCLNGSAQYSRPAPNTQHQSPNKTNRYDTPRKQSAKQEKPTDQATNETCPICLEPIKTLEVLSKCKHRFCKGCVKTAFQTKPACPICGEIYGSLIGTQPKGGNMTISRDSSSLPGYEGYGTIVIRYYIPSGHQGDEHPNPGATYQGVSRTAYLPHSPEGTHVLKLLQNAFNQRLTFTIGRSSTTGMNNVVTWNDIHHKTSRDGGPTHYGYPDPDYLNRVQDELKAKGIY